MLIRQTPKNKDAYIATTSKNGAYLQIKGFHPKYMDSEFVYFLKTEELIEFIKKEGLEKCLKS